MSGFSWLIRERSNKMKINYSYQDKAANIVFKNALKPKFKASILAACPNAGKTTISHKVINKYLAKFPAARIVVLTEGQNTLKNQYIEELKSPNIEINFTYGALDSDTQVRIGVPQSISKLNWDQIDLLIVDEAHNFYLADMIQSIIRKFNPKHQILMTGSPTKYNMHNQQCGKKYAIHYIAAEELKNMGVFSAVDMDVAKVVCKKDARGSIAAVIKKGIDNNDNLSKMMIACPSISYAKKVAAFLSDIGRQVSLSTSENDNDNLEIESFKAGLTDTLIVVGKGILGFNCKEMTFLADLRSSSNLDNSYQLFARVLRTHPDGIRKAYYRIAEDRDYNKEVLALHKMSALMRKDIFTVYNGKNLIVENTLIGNLVMKKAFLR